MYQTKLALDELLYGSSHRGRMRTYIGIGEKQAGIKVSDPVVYSYYDKSDRKQTIVLYIQEAPIEYARQARKDGPLYRNFIQAKDLAVRPLYSELKKLTGNPDIKIVYGEEDKTNDDCLVISVK